MPLTITQDEARNLVEELLTEWNATAPSLQLRSENPWCFTVGSGNYIIVYDNMTIEQLLITTSGGGRKVFRKLTRYGHTNWYEFLSGDLARVYVRRLLDKRVFLLSKTEYDAEATDA